MGTVQYSFPRLGQLFWLLHVCIRDDIIYILSRYPAFSNVCFIPFITSLMIQFPVNCPLLQCSEYLVHYLKDGRMIQTIQDNYQRE